MTTEERLAALETGLKALCKTIDLRFAAIEHARQIQFNEYARRLEDLNGHTENLRLMQSHYLPREVEAEKYERIETALASMNEFKLRAEGRMTLTHPLLVGAIGAAGGVVVLFVGLIIQWAISRAVVP